MVFQLFGLRRLAQADQVAAARAEVLELTVSVVQAEQAQTIHSDVVMGAVEAKE